MVPSGPEELLGKLEPVGPELGPLGVYCPGLENGEPCPVAPGAELPGPDEAGPEG